MTTETSVLLVLGAGASLGARVHAAPDRRPPLGYQLAEYLLAWLRANSADNHPSFGMRQRNPRDATAPSSDVVARSEFRDRVEPFLQGAIGCDFEMELRKFMDSVGIGHLAAFNRFLAFALLTGRACRFSESPNGDLYDALLCAHGFPARELTVVTLNYDILLEEAAARVASVKEPLDVLCYPGLRFIHSAVDRAMRVFKPHGSVNWLAVNNHMGTSATLSAIRTRPAEASIFEGRLVGLDTGQEWVPPGGRTNNVLSLKHARREHPVLALYTDGKPVPRNASSIDLHRQACLDHLRAFKDPKVLVVGLRPPYRSNNDPFLDQLFAVLARGRGQRVYVSPSPDDCAAAAAYGLQAIQEGLSEYVERMQSALPGTA
jgi:hypothetical protein